MIDIIKQVQEKNPGLGTTIIVLRADSRALAGPDRLTPEAQAWLDAKAPDARLVQETILLAPYPGAAPVERTVTVLSFKDAMQLAAFATAWTADPIPDEEDKEESA